MSASPTHQNIEWRVKSGDVELQAVDSTQGSALGCADISPRQTVTERVSNCSHMTNNRGTERSAASFVKEACFFDKLKTGCSI